jgi:hypothetical protein
VHFGTGEVQFLGKHGYRGWRDEPELGLDAVENFNKGAWACAVGRHDTQDGFALSWSKGLHVGVGR